MMNIYFDIETIPCQWPGIIDEFAAAVTAPGQYKKPDSIAEWLKDNRSLEAEAAWLKTSFDGGMGQIVCIGFAADLSDPECHFVADLTAMSESALLQRFFSDIDALYDNKGDTPVLVGHNHIAFDIPFIWKRAIVHNIKPPAWFPRNPRPWSDSVIDTMLLWDSTQRAGGSMDKLCRIFGMGGKGDISGADVWPLVKDGRIYDVATYCKGDVSRTRDMYRRMMFLT
jgi:3'-5' exonuclease